MTLQLTLNSYLFSRLMAVIDVGDRGIFRKSGKFSIKFKCYCFINKKLKYDMNVNEILSMPLIEYSDSNLKC